MFILHCFRILISMYISYFIALSFLFIGVGYSTSAKFERMGVINCEDLQKWNLTKLQQEFGPKTGQTLYKRCRGKDNRTVQLQKERKSVSAEINYGIRFEKVNIVFHFLCKMYLLTRYF